MHFVAYFQAIEAPLYPVIFVARNLIKTAEPGKIVMYFPGRKEFTTGPFVSVEAHATFSAVFVNWL